MSLSEPRKAGKSSHNQCDGFEQFHLDVTLSFHHENWCFLKLRIFSFHVTASNDNVTKARGRTFVS